MHKINQLMGFFLVVVVLGLIAHSVKAAELQFEQVKRLAVSESLTFDGTVEAVNQGTASAQTSGRVVEVFFDVGDLVNKDALMLRLRDSKQSAEYEAAIAAMKAATASRDAAAKEFARIEDIYAKKLVSRSVFDRALAQRDTSAASLEAAKARLKNAKVQLEYTRIRAPYSGIILKRHVEVGETVNPGMPVYSGMSLEAMRVVVDVPQKDIYQIRQFKNAQIILPTGTVLDIDGTALTFFGYADPKTSTFKVRVDLPVAVEGLYPGMYLKTSFQIGNQQVLTAPLSSIIHRGEVTAVYVASADSDNRILNFRQIRIGKKLSENTIEILSGLKQGEKVVLNPADARQLQQSKKLENSADNGSSNHE